jgi:hypothetical protein
MTYRAPEKTIVKRCRIAGIRHQRAAARLSKARVLTSSFNSDFI